MNIRDLMTRLESIEQLDEFRLKDVQAAVGQNPDADARAKIIANLAVQNKLPGLYDPVDGHYVDNTGSRTFFPPSKDVDMQLGPMGLIPPNSQSSSMLGSLTGISGDKYDQQIRGQSAKFNTDEDHREFNQEHIAKLGQLVDQLKTAKPDPVTATTTGGTTTGGTTTGGTTTSQDANTAPQINLAFNPEVKKMQDAILQQDPNALPKYHADGKLGQETIGAMQKYPDIAKQFKVQEGISIDIAKSLVESFGYETALDEYSMDQFTTDVGAGARGLGNGLTFGFGDNLLARAKAGLGVEKDYKTALEKEMANTARAKANASSFKFTDPIFHKEWNPSVYDAGELAGTIGAPIPGAQVAGALVKGGSAVAKGSRFAIDAGVNMATAMGASWLKDRFDKGTTGGLTQDMVDSLASNPDLTKQIQAQLRIPATGKLDAATLDAIAKSGKLAKKTESLTESEKIAKLREKLKQLDEANPLMRGIASDLERGGASAATKASKDLADAFGIKSVSPGGIHIPNSTVVPTKVEPKLKPGENPSANNKISNNSSSTSSVNGSGNSSNKVSGGNSTNTVSTGTQNMNPVFNIHINGAGPITAVEKKAAPEVIAAVEKEAKAVAPDVAKELEAAVATGEKKAIGTWWERNKTRVKWSTSLLGLLGLLGLTGLLVGGHDDDTTTTTTTTTTVLPGPDGKCPAGYQLSQDGKTCVKSSQEPNPAQKPTCSLAQMDLVKQIKAEMAALTKENDSGDGNVADPAVTQALQRAQEVMDAALASCTPPSGAEQAANPAPKDPRITGTVNLPGRDLKSGTVFAGDPSNGPVAESDELARWLKIARG
jgi:hypothetical protein